MRTDQATLAIEHRRVERDAGAVEYLARGVPGGSGDQFTDRHAALARFLQDEQRGIGRVAGLDQIGGRAPPPPPPRAAPPIAAAPPRAGAEADPAARRPPCGTAPPP